MNNVNLWHVWVILRINFCQNKGRRGPGGGGGGGFSNVGFVVICCLATIKFAFLWCCGVAKQAELFAK